MVPDVSTGDRSRGLLSYLFGAVPFGYRVGEDGARLLPEPGEQHVIARVRELRAAGRSLRAIVADLAGAGIVGRTRRPLGLTQVARIAESGG